jgi:hypothetical protein
MAVSHVSRGGVGLAFHSSTSMTDIEKLKRTFEEIGVPFDLTDESEERQDTVVAVGHTMFGRVFFFFSKDGSYKEFDVV